MKNALTVIAALALIAAFLVQGWQFITANSQTFDEAVHLTAGYSYLATGDFRLNHEDPPLIKVWQALPVFLYYHLPFSPSGNLWAANDEWRIGRQFLYESGVPAMSLLVPARAANLVVGAALIGLVGWWSFRLWGQGAALLAMALMGFDPNLVAHAGTLSTDVGVTLFIVMTVYCQWEHLRRPAHGWLVATGAALGLALATKFTALLLLPVLGGVILFHVLGGGAVPWPGATAAGERFWPRLRQAWGPAARVLTVAAVVLPLTYLGYGFPAWAAGLRYQLERQAHGDPSYFFFGTISSQGWWAYYPVALGLKMPLGTLAAVLLSLGFWRAGKRLGWSDAAALLVPAGLLFAVTAASRVDLGVRYLLPVFPFLFLLAGRLATIRGGIWIGTGLVGWVAFSSLGSCPHQLAYFNELSGGPENGCRVVSDSNVDWGQDLVTLRDYMAAEGIERVYLSYFGTADPAGYGIDYEAVPGFGAMQPPPAVRVPPAGRQVLVISVVNLQGIYLKPDRDLYRWLDNRQPIARLGHSLIVYDLTDDAEGRRHLDTLAGR